MATGPTRKSDGFPSPIDDAELVRTGFGNGKLPLSLLTGQSLFSIVVIRVLIRSPCQRGRARRGMVSR